MRKPVELNKLLKENGRFRIDYNPNKVLFEKSFRNLFKSAEDSEHESEIEKIIEAEMTREFDIGGHDDYNYLLGNIFSEEDYEKDENRVKDVPMCSLFIDLRNFSKRALFVDEEHGETIEEIASLKQRAMSTWIKLIKYYHGHIHSITGDGLMVLFGGEQPYDKDNWGTGARAFLLGLRVLESTNILNEELKQRLREKNLDDTNAHNLLDIKVGVEYSPKTLVNAQGVVVNGRAIGEIKLTSFEVDFSAKLLDKYGKSKEKIEGSPKYGRLLMIGEKYKELMEFSSQEVSVNKLSENYVRSMFNTTEQRSYYYLDCKELKERIIALEDVADICEVYDASEDTKQAGVNLAKGSEKIRHG